MKNTLHFYNSYIVLSITSELLVLGGFSHKPCICQVIRGKSDIILEKMLGPSPTETMSTNGDITSEGAVLEVVSVEVTAVVPMAPRLLRSKPMPVKGIPKPNKDKQKKPMPVPESPQKHSATQAQRKENLSAK